MSKENAYKFKDVEVYFDFKKLRSYDQEYLRTMFYETTLNRSVMSSGKSFNEFYPSAGSFSLFDDEYVMNHGMSEYSFEYAHTASHLLHGKKYYLAWTYEELVN